MTKLTCGECEWWGPIRNSGGDGICAAVGVERHSSAPACSPVQALAEARIELATVRDYVVALEATRDQHTEKIGELSIKAYHLEDEVERLRADLSVCQDAIKRLHAAAGTKSLEELVEVIARMRRELAEAVAAIESSDQAKREVGYIGSLKANLADADNEIDRLRRELEQYLQEYPRETVKRVNSESEADRLRRERDEARDGLKDELDRHVDKSKQIRLLTDRAEAAEAERDRLRDALEEERRMRLGAELLYLKSGQIDPKSDEGKKIIAALNGDTDAD